MTNPRKTDDCPPRLNLNGTGIVMKTIKSGDDRYFPSPTSIVRIHYEVFPSKRNPQHTNLLLDSSKEREKPYQFTLGKGETIQGLDISVFNMSLGMIAEVDIPSSLAYGEKGFEPFVPPNTALTYVIELLDFTDEDPTI